MKIACIDDFEPGQHVTFTKTFTEDDVRRFIEITGDVNPLHVDESFAASTRFERRVLHGMLTASIARGTGWRSIRGSRTKRESVSSKGSARRGCCAARTTPPPAA